MKKEKKEFNAKDKQLELGSGMYYAPGILAISSFGDFYLVNFINYWKINRTSVYYLRNDIGNYYTSKYPCIDGILQIEEIKQTEYFFILFPQYNTT